MSLFYQARFVMRFPIPLLALERFDVLVKTLPILDAAISTITECCHRHPVQNEDIIYFLERVQDLQKPPKPPNLSSGPVSIKTLGTSFGKFLSSKPPDHILLMACGWDYNKAAHLYSMEDAAVSILVIDDFLSLQQERNNYLYEAVLYGFGGSYAEDGDTSDDIDLSGASAADIMNMFK
jgi:hypothetical protein